MVKPLLKVLKTVIELGYLFCYAVESVCNAVGPPAGCLKKSPLFKLKSLM